MKIMKIKLLAALAAVAALAGGTASSVQATTFSDVNALSYAFNGGQLRDQRGPSCDFGSARTRTTKATSSPGATPRRRAS
jgi:hypothetical protein